MTMTALRVVYGQPFHDYTAKRSTCDLETAEGTCHMTVLLSRSPTALNKQTASGVMSSWQTARHHHQLFRKIKVKSDPLSLSLLIPDGANPRKLKGGKKNYQRVQVSIIVKHSSRQNLLSVHDIDFFK